jgi:hypothetical protein
MSLDEVRWCNSARECRSAYRRSRAPGTDLNQGASPPEDDPIVLCGVPGGGQ